MISIFRRPQRKRIKRLSAGILTGMTAALCLWAATAQAQQLYMATENDLLAGHDGHYTGGLELGWHAGRKRFFGRTWQEVFQLKGLVFTPRNTRILPPAAYDLPYAGVLMLNSVLFLPGAKQLSMLGLQLGWLGPGTRMGELQNQIHRWIGNDPVPGWRYQLKDRPLWGGTAGMGRLLWRDDRRSIALQGGVGVQIGTLINRGWASVLLRVGAQAGQVRLFDQMVGTSASDALEPLGRGWQLDMGVQLNGLSHLLLIEEGGKALRLRNWQWKALVRIAYGWGRWQLAWVGQIAQFPAANHRELDSWGGIVLRRQL